MKGECRHCMYIPFSFQLQAYSSSHHVSCKQVRIKSSQSTGDVSTAYQSSEPRGRHLSTGTYPQLSFKVTFFFFFSKLNVNIKLRVAVMSPCYSHFFFFYFLDFHVGCLFYRSFSGCSFFDFPFFAMGPLPFPVHHH